MKKITLFFYFLFFSYANAELIEINNCIYTATGNQKIYDIKVNKNISHEEFKYDYDYYQKYNSMLKISKKNLEKIIQSGVGIKNNQMIGINILIHFVTPSLFGDCQARTSLQIKKINLA